MSQWETKGWDNAKLTPFSSPKLRCIDLKKKFIVFNFWQLFIPHALKTSTGKRRGSTTPKFVSSFHQNFSASIFELQKSIVFFFEAIFHLLNYFKMTYGAEECFFLCPCGTFEDFSSYKIP